MAEILDPVPSREALTFRQDLVPTPVWVRWFTHVRGLLALLQADLGTLAAAVAALVQPQTTTQTQAVSGAQVLTFAAMAPAGATVLGVTWRVSTTLTGGVTGLAIGDAVAADRWGLAATVTAGTTGGSASWRGPGGFTTQAAYTVLVALTGGAVGGAGAMTCQCTWLAPLAPPA